MSERFAKLRIIILLLCAGLPLSSQDTAQSKAGTITIRFLNGKNAKPITDDEPNIWLGNGTTANPKTNSKGELAIDISGAQPREVRILPNHYADCRFKKGGAVTMRIRYSLDEILKRGVVGENYCGKARVDPIPGVLVIYVRPFTFMEKWNM